MVDFRREVSESRKNRHFGEVVSSFPSVYIWFSRVMTIVILFILITIGTMKFTRVTTVEGYLKPVNGMSTVYSSVSGRIEEVHAKNGDYISKGDSILSIVNSQEFLSDGVRVVFNNQSHQRKIMLINEQIEQLIENKATKIAEMQLLRERIKSEILGVEKLIALEVERFELTKLEIDANKKLLEQSIISIVNFTKVEQYSLSVKTEIEKLKNKLSSLKYELQRVDFQEHSENFTLSEKIATLKRSILDIQLAMAGKLKESSPLITAPISGVLHGLRMQSGQTIDPDQLVFSILPDDSFYEAEIFLPMSMSTKITTKQAIKVRVNALPVHEYGIIEGKISEISEQVFVANDIFVPITLNEPVYSARVELRFTGKITRDLISPGMSVLADIPVERTTILGSAFSAITQ